MTKAEIISNEMMSLFDESQASHLCRFFKTGKGEYGEGDKFLGIKVPVTRSIVKKYRKDITLKEIDRLVNSEWHEIRLAGFLLLLEHYKYYIKANDSKMAKLSVEFYINNIDKGNNWDLVDLVCEYILGDWILHNPEETIILYELADREDSLWHQRVAIVSTLALIRAGKFDVTFRIAGKFLANPHDLIHKATGWMLREIGKREGRSDLIEFLNKHKSIMPRTMLRYAIEKFPEDERKFFMCK